MSNHPSETASPSNSPKHISTRATPEAHQPSASSAAIESFVETPQPTAEQPVSPPASTPVIVVTGSSTSARESRSLVVRHRNSSSQPPHRSSTPYARPRSSSQPRDNPTPTASNMSSASSSPGNTSTAGATSGSSNPGYQLPYAPFPYPMPANTRGSGQQQGGQGK
ncbi:hypothetical protein FB567DRAFT_584259 [Paraphoma chrysanthemicola]|uniref:Uncharacterized protein n=1 Tax=Paraphoma chrysanthemicola TaxID=798071 RepID=A0A8K0VTD4_9PLEO|nr:hypothetical protein FB567DRAFT_584259 [Paraphoma chrysanthemicola]